MIESTIRCDNCNRITVGTVHRHMMDNSAGTALVPVVILNDPNWMAGLLRGNPVDICSQQCLRELIAKNGLESATLIREDGRAMEIKPSNTEVI